MKPLNGNLICVLEEQIEKNIAFITPDVNNKYRTLKVVNPDTSGVTKEGDVIYVPYHSATGVELKGERFFVVNVDKIMFIV